MADDGGVRPVVFSASSVTAYLDCHLRWYFTYVMNLEGEQSEAQRVGIAVHDQAEKILRSKSGSLDSSWSLQWDEYGIKEIDDLTAVFIRDILPTYRDPVLIEAPFQISVNDGVNDIAFSGIIDALDAHDMPDGHAFILRDLKTTGSRPSKGRYRFNMVGYYLGATIGLDYRVHAMQLDYVVRTRQPYYWPEVVDLPDDDDLAAWVSTLSRVAAGVAKGDYEPTGLGTRACSYCPYQAVCGPYQRYQELISPLRKEVNQ